MSYDATGHTTPLQSHTWIYISATIGSSIKLIWSLVMVSWLEYSLIEPMVNGVVLDNQVMVDIVSNLLFH